MLEYLSRSFDESIINERKKKEKKSEKSLIFEDSRYLGDRELSLESRSRFSGEESRRRSKQTRNLATYASGRTRARNGGRAVAATALSCNRASLSVPRSFLPCRKTCDSMHKTFYCVTCAVFSGLVYHCPRVPETVRINSRRCIILSALHKWTSECYNWKLKLETESRVLVLRKLERPISRFFAFVTLIVLNDERY